MTLSPPKKGEYRKGHIYDGVGDPKLVSSWIKLTAEQKQVHELGEVTKYKGGPTVLKMKPIYGRSDAKQPEPDRTPPETLMAEQGRLSDGDVQGYFGAEKFTQEDIDNVLQEYIDVDGEKTPIESKDDYEKRLAYEDAVKYRADDTYGDEYLERMRNQLEDR